MNEADRTAVAESLTGLLDEAQSAARRGDEETVADVLTSVETVARNKIPDEDLRERLVHGCSRVAYLGGDDPAAAAEYLRAMSEAVERAAAGR